MWRGLRTLLVLSSVCVLILPVSASSALPAIGAIKIALAIAGAAWTGFNLVFVGARSAAFARADEIWVSDPPNITHQEFDAEGLASDTAEWNIGRSSAVSIANATAPSGNAITIRAETNWEPISFTFSSTINMTDFNLVNTEGVLWGEGFAFGTLEGIVTKEFPMWIEQDENDIPIAELPLKYVVSEISLPYEENFGGVSLDLSFHAWKMDSPDTEPDGSSWHQQILLASVSLDGPTLEHLQVDGDLDKHRFMDQSLVDSTRVDVLLEEAIERQIMLRVPFSDEAERVVLAFRVEVKGTLQIGKR